MVNRSIRRAFRRMGLTILAAACVLILFVQFCLPTIVSCFYYNPAKNIGDKDYAISKMSRDMAVYSGSFSTREKERFCAGGSKRIWEL